MKKCIVVDWVQIRVLLPVRPDNPKIGGYVHYPDTVNDSRFLTVRDDLQQTQMFKEKYTILTKCGDEVGVLVANPRSGLCMAENEGILKLSNKYLYQVGLVESVKMILRELHLTFLNYTRTDFALDFEKFDTMEVRRFIEMVADKELLKERRAKFAANGTTWSVGDHGQETGGYETISFGTAKSAVTYTLYNKTLEMSQVKIKPWIVDNWISNGYTGENDVWRLEFQISKTKDLVRDCGGQLYSMADIDFISHASKIFEAYFKTHFSFVYREKTASGQLKKQSRCRRLTLFTDFKFEAVKERVKSEQKDSGRSEKVFAKALLTLNRELSGMDFDLAIAGNEILTWVIQTRGLKDWTERKFGNVRQSQKVIDKISAGNIANIQGETAFGWVEAR